MPIKKKCQYCGNTFITNDKRQKYCSTVCYHLSRRKAEELRICLCCKKKFKPKNPKQKFCSRRCSAIWRAKDGLPWGRRWTKEEEEKLRELYPYKTNKEIALELKRSERAIRRKAEELGLRKDPSFFKEVCNRRKDRKPWTDKEIEILRKLYPIKATEDISRILNRSVYAIKRMAQKLGLKKERPFAKLGNAYQLKGLIEQRKVVEQLKKEGWKVVEPENAFDFYDAIIQRNGKSYIVDIKWGKKYTIKSRTLQQMMKTPYSPAILCVTPDGERFLLEVRKI